MLESLAQYEQLEKDGNLQEDVNYYIKDAKLVIRNNEKYGTSINDSASSVSTTYSSAKIEEINTQVWSGTTSEFEALDKTTLKDGQVVNITDDYDEPDTKDVYSLEEVKTKKVWIDGKPVYRKVIQLPAITAGSEYNVDLSSLTPSTYVRLYGFTQVQSGNFHPVLTSDTEDTELNVFVSILINKLRVMPGRKRNVVNGFIVIEYTKTTD